MNEAKLLQVMADRKITKVEICRELGISRSAFYRKCKGITEFTQGEIQKIVDILSLDSPMEIFFAR